MTKLIELYKKYKMQILYIFFGGVTTVVNIAIYMLFYEILFVENVASTVIAWFISVLVAFYTNKFYVFESKNFKCGEFLYEIGTFFACRVGTGGLDVGIMWASVDILGWNALLMKIISNIMVIILNYIVSKVIIFKSK